MNTLTGKVIVALFAMCVMSGCASKSSSMESLYNTWAADVDHEADVRQIGYPVAEDDLFCSLDSFKTLVAAPVSDQEWSSFVINKIDENQKKKWNERDDKVYYLAFAACKRFNWTPYQLLSLDKLKSMRPPGANVPYPPIFSNDDLLQTVRNKLESFRK